MEIAVCRSEKIGIIDLDTLRGLASWLASRQTTQVEGDDSCLHSRSELSPPRQSPAVTIPLANLWTQGSDPNARQELLQVLSRIAAKRLRSMCPQVELIANCKEVSDE